MESSFFLGRETLIPRKTSPLTLWRDRLFILMFGTPTARPTFQHPAQPGGRVQNAGRALTPQTTGRVPKAGITTL